MQVAWPAKLGGKKCDLQSGRYGTCWFCNQESNTTWITAFYFVCPLCLKIFLFCHKITNFVIESHIYCKYAKYLYKYIYNLLSFFSIYFSTALHCWFCSLRAVVMFLKCRSSSWSFPVSVQKLSPSQYEAGNHWRLSPSYVFFISLLVISVSVQAF